MTGIQEIDRIQPGGTATILLTPAGATICGFQDAAVTAHRPAGNGIGKEDGLQVITGATVLGIPIYTTVAGIKDYSGLPHCPASI